MQIELSETLLKNRDEWYFDGWRAVAKDKASDKIKMACQQHNKLILEVVGVDDTDE